VGETVRVGDVVGCYSIDRQPVALQPKLRTKWEK
jgi:hypothetical protein